MKYLNFIFVLCFLAACTQKKDKQLFDHKKLAGNWVNKTVLDAAIAIGPYFDSTLYWPATEMVIDSLAHTCLLINQDLEHTPYICQFTTNRILLINPLANDTIAMKYDVTKDRLYLHDESQQMDFEFVRANNKDVDYSNLPHAAFKTLLRRQWLVGTWEAQYGDISRMDAGNATISIEPNGNITGWNKANRCDVFINGDYSSFSDHPVLILYRDSIEDLYLWERLGDTINLYRTTNLYLAGEKPYYGKGKKWGTLIKQSKDETSQR